MNSRDIRTTWGSLEVFTQLLQTLTPCAEGLWRGGRGETTNLLLSLVLGICVTTKHLILVCLLSRSVACFIEPWKHASNTAHTGKNNSLEKWQKEGKSTTVLICVFYIAWTLFVHVTQCTSGTNNKALSTIVGKIKTNRLKIGRSIYISSRLSMLLCISFTFRVHRVNNHTLKSTLV